ncbi:MAG TPA: rhomboid family intramembrane serine protease [Verrucomicrobiae bacterium]|nr:rhomboid family intramembrane serine protease [Verrucomicrobiae bacterium]
MGLADRYYMRQSSGGLNWSATTTLLVVNWIIFLLQVTALPPRWAYYLYLSPEGLAHGFVWQLLTFQFLHDPNNWLHIIFNSLGLFFIGRAVESMLGTRRFTHLYLLSGIAGGLLQMLLGVFVPSRFGGLVAGASAGLSGLIATFAMMNWSNRFTMFLYFFPVPMTGRILLWISLGFAIFGLVMPSGNVAHAAHLGGLLLGVIWVKVGWHLDYVVPPWERWIAGLSRLSPWNRRERKRQLVRAAIIRNPNWTAMKNISAEIPEEEFISKEVDPILDKISAHGIQSLTDRERAILERARNKMAK